MSSAACGLPLSSTHLPAWAPAVIRHQLPRAASSAKDVVDDVLGQRGEIDAAPVRALAVIESPLSKKRTNEGNLP